MKTPTFELSKWYLDCINEKGEAWIFYAANLKYRSVSIHYTSWTYHHPLEGTTESSRFRQVAIPEIQKDTISWKDETFNISGKWTSNDQEITARIYEDEMGFVDWKCFQPKSHVDLNFQGRSIQGTGYVEVIHMTTYPWNIPMDELRWGRFHSPTETLVWIETIKDDLKKQWLWMNGNQHEDWKINDESIHSPDYFISLQMDRKGIIESDRKIFQVVEKLLHFIPGVNKIMPLHFLLAKNNKWLSKGSFMRNEEESQQGYAIHEWVHFQNEQA